MKLSDALLQEIKYRNPIEEVISSYVSLKRNGSNAVGLCPFHSEKTPSFSVSSKNQFFYCFGCGAGGDVITFLMKAENLDYMSAVRTLAQRAGISLPITEAQQEQGVKRARVLEMNMHAAKFFRAALPSAQNAQEYLKKRALAPPLVAHFGLGYAPGRGALVSHLRSLGYTEEELIAASLARKSEKNGRLYDFFSERLMFPILDTLGNVIGFGGRVLGEGEPKYLNSPDTPAFLKRNNLFALNYAKKHCAEALILCEGYMDVIALHGAGFQNAVATLGTAITPEQARLMRRHAPLVYICYDSDAAGQRATEKAIALLTEADVEVRVVRYEGAKDPDELIRRFGRERFSLALEQAKPQFDFKTDSIFAKFDLRAPQEKIKAAHAVCEMIAAIPSPMEREIYITRCAQRLEVTIPSLTQDVERLLRQKNKKQQKEKFTEIARQAEGVFDRINPERVGNTRANGAEEVILGTLLLFPEYLQRITAPPYSLTADDFVTAFHRRVFAALCAKGVEGGFEFGHLGEDFTPDEMGRITRLSVRRRDLHANPDEVLRDSIRTLKEEKSRQDEDIFAILRRKQAAQSE